MKEKTLNTVTILLSIVLLVVSLTQSAYCTRGCTTGCIALLFGPFGVLMEVGKFLSYVLETFVGKTTEYKPPAGAMFVWLANPIWLVAVMFFIINKKASLILSATSLLIMLSFLACSRILSDEAGNYTAITAMGPGYWLWVLSAAVLVIASIAGIQLYKHNTD